MKAMLRSLRMNLKRQKKRNRRRFRSRGEQDEAECGCRLQRTTSHSSESHAVLAGRAGPRSPDRGLWNQCQLHRQMHEKQS